MKDRKDRWLYAAYLISLLITHAAYQYLLSNQRELDQRRVDRRQERIVDLTKTINALNRDLDRQKSHYQELDAMLEFHIQFLESALKKRDQTLDAYERLLLECRGSLRQCVELKRIPDR